MLWVQFSVRAWLEQPAELNWSLTEFGKNQKKFNPLVKVPVNINRPRGPKGPNPTGPEPRQTRGDHP